MAIYTLNLMSAPINNVDPTVDATRPAVASTSNLAVDTDNGFSSDPAILSPPLSQALFSSQTSDPGDSSMSYSELLKSGVPLRDFCRSHSLHANTIRLAASRQDLSLRPLLEVSHLAQTVQDAEEALASQHQETVRHALARPLSMPAFQPLINSVFSVSSQAPVADEPVAPIALPTVPDNGSGDNVASGSEMVNVRLDDRFDSITAPGQGPDIRRPTSLFDDAVTDSSINSDDPALEATSLRDMFQLINDSLPEVFAVPLPSSRDTTIRSALQTPAVMNERLCLTTSPCIAACVQKRQQELKDQADRGNAKDYLRISSSDVLKVKMAIHTPGDSVWPIDAPPLPHGFSPWLPTMDKNSKVALTYHDVCNLESMLRCCQKGTGDVEAALSTVTTFMDESADPMLARLFNFIGASITNLMKLQTAGATALFQVRRDLALASSTFNTDERRQLRFSPYVGATALFSPDLLTQLCIKARERVDDERRHQSWRWVPVPRCHRISLVTHVFSLILVNSKHSCSSINKSIKPKPKPVKFPPQQHQQRSGSNRGGHSGGTNFRARAPPAESQKRPAPPPAAADVPPVKAPRDHRGRGRGSSRHR